MNKIFLIILFSYLEFIFNEEIFFNVTKDNYKKTFENLTKGNIYNFVFPAIPFENVYFALATNKTYYFSPNISIYNYISYSSNYSEGNKQNNLVNKRKEVNGEFTYSYEIYLNDSNSEYLGIQLTMQKNLNYLTLIIITKNIFDFQNYYGSYKGKLFAFIPYSYFSNVDNKKKFEINIYSKSFPNKPFDEFYITEYNKDNKTLFSYKVNPKDFTHGNSLTVVNEIIYKESAKKVSYKFIANFDIEDFDISIDIPYDGPYDEPSEKVVINYRFFAILGFFGLFICIAIITIVIFYGCPKTESSSIDRQFQFQQQNQHLNNFN